MTTHTRHYRGFHLSTLRIRATKPDADPLDWDAADVVLAPLGLVPCGPVVYHLINAVGRVLAFVGLLTPRSRIDRHYGGEPCQNPSPSTYLPKSPEPCSTPSGT